MPLYDYVCTKCGHSCERITSFAERDQQLCDRCNRYYMVRLISASAIQYSYPAGHARAGRGGTGGSKND